MQTAALILMLETGHMREGEQYSREKMGPLVCMSLEDRERSVSTGIVPVIQMLDCGDVTYQIPME